MITLFQKRVLKLVKKIPKGKVTTYKWLANGLNKPKSYRAVANALGKNPNLIKIPCYKVIRSNGEVGGYKLGQKKKKELLIKEGIRIKNKKIINFKKHLFLYKNK